MFRQWLEICLVGLIMLALAIISTYPLVQYFDQGIPYAPYGGPLGWNRTGDMLQLLYWFWVVKENLIGAVPFDTNPFEFNMLVAHETSGLHTIPLAFLYFLFTPFGDVAAYNCTVLSSYVLSGVFMYLLVRLYTGSRMGAFLAAIIFTFAPIRIHGVSSGHGYGFLFFLYPFILYFLEKGIRSQKIRYGFLSGFGLLCLAMLEPHLIYYICVFLGVYIPVRIVSLFPVTCSESIPPSEGICKHLYSLPTSRSLLILWGSGIAAIFYTQVLFSCRDHDMFAGQFFWWILGIYPFIPILLSICLASMYQRLFPLSFRQGLAVEAGSILPLYFLIPLSGVTCIYRPADTSIVVATLLVMVVGVKLILLSQHLLAMFKTLKNGFSGRKNMVLPILPLVCSMGLTVVWIMSSKVNKISSTIAGRGRTLRDVELFTSHLSDLFKSTSPVYFGIVPTILSSCLLLTVIWYAIFYRKHEKIDDEAQLIRLFYVVAAFCSYVLALGLAFGKSSLYVFFFHYFPFFNYPRVSDRIMTVVLFAGAIVVAFTVKGIQNRCMKTRSHALVILVFVFAMGLQLKDYNILRPMGITLLDKGQDIYSYVKENIDDGLLLEIPLWPGDSHQSSFYQHYIMIDKVKRVNGYSPLVLNEYIETVSDPLSTMNAGILNKQQYELLRKLNVKFVTVHEHENVFPKKVTAYGPLTTVRRFMQSPYLEYVDIDNYMHFKTFDWRNEGMYLFKVKEDVPAEADNGLNYWYEMPVFYDVNNRLNHLVGEVVEDKEIGRKVFQATEGKDKAGFLVYGPYETYSPGNYRCYFSIFSDTEQEDNVVRLEVSRVGTGETVHILNQAELKGNEAKGAYRKVFLDFSIAKKEKLEFRVFYYGIGTVRVEKVVVYRRGHDAPLYLLEAEKMVGDTGSVVHVKDAFSGKVIEAKVGKSKKEDLVFGPGRIYNSGRYKARFYLRMKDAGNIKKTDVVALLSVTDGQDLSTFFKRNVLAGELSENAFTGIDAEFELSRDEELSFHVRFADKVNMQLDAIEITMQRDDNISH